MPHDPQLIRNFSIIAHIDHGKTTLSDRLIETCQGLDKREMQAQVLDSMDIERERGITIKAQSVTLYYEAKNKKIYQLNFIDTPGHVDFSYEVSRALGACEGALLVVDASQGVEAQSVANCYKAIDFGLEVVPVLNKMDLPQVEPARVKQEIEEIIGIASQDAIEVSAKSGLGIQDLLERLVQRIPPPKDNRKKPFQALIVDSWFDPYLGVVVLIRIVSGLLKKGDKILMKSTGGVHRVESLGVFTPKRVTQETLESGQVGFVVASVRDIHGAPVGDTMVLDKDETTPALTGFEKVKPVVYAGLYPVSSDDYSNFRDALEKLTLNDASLSYEPESADALGQGFRCGFLGLLHMEIIQERLEREYGLNLITTTPSVVYDILLKSGKTLQISKPSSLPDRNTMEAILEPIAEVNILTPEAYVGRVIELCSGRRGIQKSFSYVGRQISLKYEVPMADVVIDFFDEIKSISKGYASFDFSLLKMQESSLVRVDLLVNGEKAEPLSFICHQDDSRNRGIAVIEKLQELIPRQMFEVALQVAIGGKIIARGNVRAMRKNVLAKCYGGDITRKKKLLEKQKEGKKRMKHVGNVEIPQEAFLAVMRSGKSRS